MSSVSKFANIRVSFLTKNGEFAAASSYKGLQINSSDKDKHTVFGVLGHENLENKDFVSIAGPSELVLLYVSEQLMFCASENTHIKPTFLVDAQTIGHQKNGHNNFKKTLSHHKGFQVLPASVISEAVEHVVNGTNHHGSNNGHNDCKNNLNQELITFNGCNFLSSQNSKGISFIVESNDDEKKSDKKKDKKKSGSKKSGSKKNKKSSDFMSSMCEESLEAIQQINSEGCALNSFLDDEYSI